MAKQARKLTRSSYSGKIINGRSVILAEEAEEYLKKMGYEIIPPIQYKKKEMLIEVIN